MAEPKTEEAWERKQRVLREAQKRVDVAKAGYPGESLEALVFSEEVLLELARACALHAPMHSAHEAYAVILEEVEEFWEEARKKEEVRTLAHLRSELLQIAAMAIRAAVDLHLVLGQELPNDAAPCFTAASKEYMRRVHAYSPS